MTSKYCSIFDGKKAVTLRGKIELWVTSLAGLLGPAKGTTQFGIEDLVGWRCFCSHST